MEASKLNQILDQHKLWLETNEVQGERANLEGADLMGADLGGANLMNANLIGANLNRAYLTGANLLYADLTDADLRGANLRGAILTHANLEGAFLEFANLTDALLEGAFLEFANLTGADLRGAILRDADLTDAILPDISWIIPGCLVQLNENMHGFYLKKENKSVNFVQDSFGFFIQDNREEKTFDMLVEDRIMRNIPDWVKLSGLKQIESV